jgi:hypothetical protein
MKWKHKPYVWQPNYWWFAWFPVVCKDGYWRWLEKVWVQERYINRVFSFVVYDYFSAEQAGRKEIEQRRDRERSKVKQSSRSGI